MRAVKHVNPPSHIKPSAAWIDDAAKAKILSETDPETVICNFEKHTSKKISLAENLTDEEIKTGLFIIKRATIGHIEYKQGETLPLEEAFDQIKKDLMGKYPNEKSQNNNKQRCQKRHL